MSILAALISANINRMVERNKQKRFVVQNTEDPSLFWSNEFGWVNLSSCDRFTETERNALNLPIEGQWRRLN